MPDFGRRSRMHRDTCHPDLILVLDDAIQVYDFSILCGERGQEAQNEAFSTGKSQVQYPDSKHNKTPSNAFDAAPWFQSLPHIDWNNLIAFGILNGVIQTCAHRRGIKIRWGGYFTTLKDYGHWELADE